MDSWVTLGSGCKVVSFQVFFSLSALRLSLILDFHLIYVIIKPTVSEDTGLIYSLVLCKLPIMLNLKLSVTSRQTAMAAKLSNVVALERMGGWKEFGGA